MTEDKSEKNPTGKIEALPGIGQAVDEMVQARLRAGHQPLGPDELLDFLDGELTEEQHQDFQDRLVYDRVAVQDLIELDTFPQAHEPVSEEDEAAWLNFRKRLQEEGQIVSPPFGKPVSRRNPFPHVLVHGLLLVACLVLAFTGPFKKGGSPAKAQPNLRAGVLEIRLDEVGTRSSGISPLRFQGPQQTLYIKLPQRWRDFPLYGFEILDGPQVIYSELVPGPLSHLNCLLSEGFFQKPGVYRIFVYGKRDGKRLELGDFDLQVAL